MMTCAICRKPIKEDGWGGHAYATADGSQYIHHKCRPAPPPPKPGPEATGEPHSPDSQFLTLPDAARLLGLSPETLRRRIQNQTLKAFRLDGGQTILIERAELLRLLHRL